MRYESLSFSLRFEDFNHNLIGWLSLLLVWLSNYWLYIIVTTVVLSTKKKQYSFFFVLFKVRLANINLHMFFISVVPLC